MRFKIIQVNIFKGKYLDALVEFINDEKPDFVTMQEVTTNRFNFYKDQNISLFQLLCEKLNMYGEYHGDLKLIGDETSLFGNAVFSKYPILEKHVVTLKSFRPVSLDELDSDQSSVRELIDRHVLDVRVDVEGFGMHVLSWHGAWTAPPHDNEETFRQANIVYGHLKNIDPPLILCGDLNSTIDSKTVRLISSVTQNFMENLPAETVTTNTKVHKIAPRGYLIDYIFASRDFKLINLRIPQITVSDHLPVIAEVEF